MKERLLLIGGGGHCAAVIDVIETIGSFEILGIVDKKENLGREVLGYKIIGTDDDLPRLVKDAPLAVITVGHIQDNTPRVRLYNLLREIGFKLPNIVSPSAYVSRHARLGEGNVIMHHSLINAGASIGNNCIINTKALVEHNAVVEDHCHIATAAIVNGGVVVKENTFFGSNATTKQYSTAQGFIKAGSIVK